MAALGSVFSDIVDAVVDEFTTDVGRINIGTLLIMAVVVSGTTPWRVLWAFGKLVSFTLLALLKRVPDNFDPSEPDFSERVGWHSVVLAITGLLSIFLVQNVTP